MQPRHLFALTLAAALASPASAGGMSVKDPLDASKVGSLMVVSVPLMLFSEAGRRISYGSVLERMANNKRWEVTKVHPQGAKTALELRSMNEGLKMEIAVATATARSQAVQVHDALDIEAVGQAGYTVRKGAKTIGILSSGMVHSQAR